MTRYLTLTPFGIFLLNESGEVSEKKSFYPDVSLSSTVLFNLNEGNIEEIPAPVNQFLTGIAPDSLIVSNPNLAAVLKSNSIDSFTIEEDSDVLRMFRSTEGTHLLREEIVGSKDDIDQFRQKVSLEVARRTISKAIQQEDLLVKNAVDAVNEIDKSINMVAMRLREWYTLHFPSLSDLIEDHETLARIITLSGNKTEIDSDLLEKAGVSDELAARVLDSSVTDIGAPFSKRDVTAITSLAELILTMHSQRKELEEYITNLMQSVAPNMTALAGSMVSARLISLAGSLKDLARKPSSTIQIYGAEKALFRSMKTKATPPKHGVIFQVPLIHSAPYWQRGKLSRALAGKLTIAARVDAYSDRDIGDELLEDLNSRVEEIRKQYPEPSEGNEKKRDETRRKSPKSKQRGRG